jgi:dolichol-phosphate mannosyltransferase
MVKLWQEGYDVVYAKRSVRKDKFLKRFSAFLFYRVLSSVSSIDIPWDTGDFRLIDRKVLNALNSLPEKTRFLRGQIPWLGFKQVGISIDRGARVVGESSYTIKRLFKLAFDGLLSFSAMPLFLVPVLGLALFAIATLSMFVCIVAMFFLPEASISLQLFLAVSFVSALIGLQTGLLGILAIYLTKVLDEVRGRPVYIVAERLGQGFGEQASVARNSTLSTSNVFSGAEYGNSLAPPRL